MPEPIIERIVDRFARRLRAAMPPEAPAASGYNTTLRRVYRALVLPGEVDEIPYACVVTGDETGDYTKSRLIQNFVDVEVYVFVADDDLEAVDRVANRAAQDIKKAILSDVNLSPGGQSAATSADTDGGLVDRCQYQGTTQYPIGADAPNIEGRVVRFQFQYVHAPADPYTGRA